MARGRRKELNLSLEEQLENIQVEIDEHTETLKTLKSKKKEILKKISDKEKEDVYRAFLDSGKSLSDFKMLLQSLTVVEGEIGTKKK
ncbi:MAG: flagellar export protein FliJ [Clostridiales bacterium]|nr:flagellar export protein FliJ [Clostridiales bacterium]MDU3241915.1 flagellar export protein FliJ [Clostridiales bacterium]